MDDIIIDILRYHVDVYDDQATEFLDAVVTLNYSDFNLWVSEQLPQVKAAISRYFWDWLIESDQLVIADNPMAQETSIEEGVFEIYTLIRNMLLAPDLDDYTYITYEFEGEDLKLRLLPSGEWQYWTNREFWDPLSQNNAQRLVWLPVGDTPFLREAIQDYLSFFEAETESDTDTDSD